MLVLWDKGFDGNDFLAAVTGTGAQILGRLRSNHRAPILSRLADGSYLSAIGTVSKCGSSTRRSPWPAPTAPSSPAPTGWPPP